jgi:hypothetical protein
MDTLRRFLKVEEAVFGFMENALGTGRDIWNLSFRQAWPEASVRSGVLGEMLRSLEGAGVTNLRLQDVDSGGALFRAAAESLRYGKESLSLNRYLNIRAGLGELSQAYSERGLGKILCENSPIQPILDGVADLLAREGLNMGLAISYLQQERSVTVGYESSGRWTVVAPCSIGELMYAVARTLSEHGAGCVAYRNGPDLPVAA